MVTREVGRDRLVRAWLARRESYKRRREEKRSQQPGLLQQIHTAQPDLTKLALVSSIHRLNTTTTYIQSIRMHMPYKHMITAYIHTYIQH